MTEQLKVAHKARVAARAWVTRTGNKILTLTRTAEVDKQELALALSDFKGKVRRLDEVQEEVETLLDSDSIEEDIDKAMMYREQSVAPVLLAAEKILLELCPASHGCSVVNSAASVEAVDAKLPKLQLPVFAGNIMEWGEFWEQFQAIVDKSDIPEIMKFSYLKSLLDGEAKAAVAGLSLTAG